MNKYEFSKDHYFFEISRNQQFTSSLTLPIGISVAISGALGYYLSNLSDTIQWASVLLYFFIIISVIFLIRTIYYLIKAYHKYEYRYIPHMEDVKKYYQKIVDQYKEDYPDEIEPEFENYVINTYSRCSTWNSVNNDQKSGYLHKANENLIWALIFTLITAVPYFFDNKIYNSNITSVELVKGKCTK